MFVKSPESGEEKAHWVMPALDTGDELICLVMLDKTENMALQNNAGAANDPLCPNLRLWPQTDDLCPPPANKKPNPQPKVETASEDDDDFVVENWGPFQSVQKKASFKFTGRSHRVASVLILLRSHKQAKH